MKEEPQLKRLVIDMPPKRAQIELQWATPMMTENGLIVIEFQQQTPCTCILCEI